MPDLSDLFCLELVDQRCAAVGVSRSAVAVEAGFDKSAVSRWFNGCHSPSVANARQYAQAAERLIQDSRAQERELIIVGIDPGAKGAISVARAVPNAITLRASESIPQTKIKVSNRKQSVVDIGAFIEQVDRLMMCFGPADELFVERVGAHPRQGLSTTFHFGMATGLETGIATAILGLQPHRIESKQWQSLAGVQGGPDVKDNSLARARELFGEDQFPLKKDSDRADSALIAYAGCMLSQ